MNRTLRPRAHGNRVADSLRSSRSAGIVPRAVGLVGGIADSPERKAPPKGTRRRAIGVGLQVMYLITKGAL